MRGRKRCCCSGVPNFISTGAIIGEPGGTPINPGAAPFEPFTDAPNTSGLMLEENIPEGKMKQTIKDADRAGRARLCAHATEGGEAAAALVRERLAAVGIRVEDRIGGPRWHLAR